MTRKKLKPVTVAGIEFDALIEEQKTMSSTIPAYPVEKGFPVSDTIILDPLSVQMTLYVSCTPVTWLYRHGSSTNRVAKICEQLEDLWLDKKLVKIVTTDAIYTNMGITSISIKKSKDVGYDREISLSAQKIRITERKIVGIPSYALKSGKTKASAGAASTSKSSGKANAGAATQNNAGKKSLGASNSGNSAAKKKKSILYGVAENIGFI